ncbi:unnamed protein product [Bursaphelenchus xylophilus]|uniref:(pine wood nematode) hypothetical protein n=1 Tax=Bursaphelenchus xylophilus TaxID=6326 RepID=A0A1I7SFS2_BURXY|nr:unnamed protein product [Bursaphelenchus xylophilus]CAG9114367.1 unnamed protein product [Bursaphelenchus xylophilus]
MSNRCKICGDASIGIQFGVRACRGCSAFFRRTIVEKRQYDCWRNERCKVIPGVRNSCRECRFKRCVKLGMKEERVQPRRDKNMTIVVANPLTPPHTRKDVPTTSKNSDVLSRLSAGFETYMIAKKAVFITKRPELAVFEHDEMITVPASEKVELEMLTFPSTYAVLRDYFLDFVEMDKQVKFKLLDAFLGRFYQLERVWVTAQRFVKTKQFHKYALSAYDYIDMTRQEDFFQDDIEAQKSFQPYAVVLQQFARKIDSLEVDQKEFAALIGLMAVHIVASLYADKADKQLRKILDELQEHVSKRYSDRHKRVAQIILLLRDVETTTEMFNECFFLGVVVNDIYRQALDRLGEISDYYV